ncbi:MAG: peptidoglycan-binding domain-containing protein, partial [Patescibacteria group bacterium]
MKNYKLFLAVAGLLGLSGFLFGQVNAQTVSTCDFTRNLEVGDAGEDVLCLQKFLNGAGFTIATSGVGSPGAETDLFGELTKEALMRWQVAQGITPASGYFGPKSRVVYGGGGAGSSSVAGVASPISATTTVAPTPILPTIPELVTKLNEYAVIIKKIQDERDALEQNLKNENETRKLLQKAQKLIEEADSFIDLDERTK